MTTMILIICVITIIMASIWYLHSHRRNPLDTSAQARPLLEVVVITQARWVTVVTPCRNENRSFSKGSRGHLRRGGSAEAILEQEGRIVFTYRWNQKAYGVFLPDSARVFLAPEEFATLTQDTSDSPGNEVEAQLNLSHPLIDLHGADLSGVDFSGKTMAQQCFAGANLAQTIFVDGVFTFCDFSETNLEEANFSGADLRGCNFAAANLTGADLRKTDLRGCSFHTADCTEVTFDPSIQEYL